MDLVDIKSIYLNGVEITGLADDSSAVSFPEIEKYQSKQGADGTRVIGSTGKKGGDVVFKLMASSPSIKFFNGLYNLTDLGGMVTLEGVINYTNNTSVLLEGGWIMKGSSGVNSGNSTAENVSYTINFNRIFHNTATGKY